MLGDRRIDDTARTELLQEALCDLVGATVLGNFLAHDENALVSAHFFRHGIAKRFANGHRHHFGTGRNFRIVRHGCLRLGWNRSSRLFFHLWGSGGGRRLRGRCCRNIGGRLAVLQQDCDLGVDLHIFGTGRHQQLTDDAFINGFDFHRRLIGFDLGNDVT